ncbi:MAG: Gfo/Idh/MocA family oxidoreductase [Burkholderiales bacterium]
MINAAIVGLGRWGQNLVNSVQGKSEKIRFVAGVLRHPEKARAYANEKGIALHSHLDTVLTDPGIDAIVLATPHTLHAEQIIASIRAGKPVFTEKPFTLTSRSAAQAVRAAAEENVTVGVGYNWRFQPALQEIRRMLEDGRLGKLLHIEGNFCGPSVYRFGKDHWRQQRDEGPAGGMTGRGVHVVDAMIYLAGHVETVHAQSYRRALDYGIDDTTSMLFKFKNGPTGYLGTMIATAETWRMQVFASRGWVEVGDVEHLTTWQMRVCSVDPQNPHTHQKPQLISFPETSTERAELEHFADAVRSHRPLAVAGGDEAHGVAVLEAILASAKSGDTITVGTATGERKDTIANRTRRVAAKATRSLKKAVSKSIKKAKQSRSTTARASAKKRSGGSVKNPHGRVAPRPSRKKAAPRK